ncbi:MAG: UbiA family prenyltransferase, partial [Eggerthellaceae bacterium]|nr:UbiA family prenyltransferase [Eggerthellaceae bacterium]
MGGLIPLAVHQVVTGKLDFSMLLLAIPTIIGVGLIMFTNNTCDIERDIPSGRKTLPVLLGRDAAVRWYHIAVIVWIVDIIVNVAVVATPGLIVIPFMLLAAYPLVKALFGNPMTPERRIQAMPQILSVNIVLGAFYCAALLAPAAVTLVL